MRRFTNTLKQYSAFSACFLALQHDVEGQAVYTDIDPDIVLDISNESAGVDMDNNGSSDFAFINLSFGFPTYSSVYSSHFEALDAGPQSPNNAIAALTHVISPSYGGFTVYFPFALTEGALVHEGLIFNNNGYQRMAYRYTTVNGFYFPYGGLWYPEVVDHYLGVRFVDTTECTHYGWIRCDVLENGRKLVIKDYAYESKCETGIPAGDTIGDTSVSINEYNTFNGAIYTFNSKVYITLNDLPANCIARITNMSGSEIYSGAITHNFMVISMMNKPKGIYVVELFSDKQRIAVKKIIIN